MKYLTALIVLGAIALGVRADDFEFGGMKSPIPKGWKEEKPSSSMRVGQYKLPKADGDDAEAELAFFILKGSGSLEDNLKRQVAKFKPAEGKKEVESKVEKIKVGKNDATLQDVKGIFLSKFPPFDPKAKITEKANYRQLYVVFTNDGGDFYMTLLGPEKTIEKNKADFEGFLKNFK